MKLVSKKSNLAKFGLKLRKTDSVAGNSDASSENSGGNSWLTKGAGNIAARVESIKTQQARGFAPEVYFKDGESKKIRFRGEALGIIQRYSVRINGKWRQFTAPAAGDRDLFRENGLKASSKVLYEVIDRDGYVDKKGQKHRNEAKFFLAAIRVHEQLETIRRKKGGLQGFDIEISRNGAGTKTTYTLIPEDPETFDFSKVPSIRRDVEKYYAPPSLAEQKAIFSNYDPADNEDDN